MTLKSFRFYKNKLYIMGEANTAYYCDPEKKNVVMICGAGISGCFINNNIYCSYRGGYEIDRYNLTSTGNYLTVRKKLTPNYERRRI